VRTAPPEGVDPPPRPLPIEVGVRALRDDLSRYLCLAADGVDITITRYGRPVARISGTASSRLDQLIAAGVVTPPPSLGPRPVPRPMAVDATVSDLVAEQRR